ncbi:hypothetical protein [Metabacillus sp. FJAT-53654]|uniref:Uncharacterized protein n=1 Tax=Metabacillus rhizosphaerae TaxID=3117747 RepID=A0ABZ2MP85_9BACI
MGLFNKKTKEEEISLNAGRIAELQAEKAKFEGVLRGLEIELELGEDSSLKKRHAKVEKKVNELSKEIKELDARQAELNKAIADENARQRREAIEEAAQKDKEQACRGMKRRLLDQKLEGLQNQLYGRYGLPSADSLASLAGVRYGENFRPDQEDYKSAAHNALLEGEEQAKKEFEKLWKQISDYLEMKI